MTKKIVKKVKIQPSKREDKKLVAIFYTDDGKKVKTTHFGAKGMSDFTKHGDPERKNKYIKRHKARENFEDFLTAGSLSRYVLWEKKDLEASKKFYANRFNLELL